MSLYVSKSPSHDELKEYRVWIIDKQNNRWFTTVDAYSFSHAVQKVNDYFCKEKRDLAGFLL